MYPVSLNINKSLTLIGGFEGISGTPPETSASEANYRQNLTVIAPPAGSRAASITGSLAVTLDGLYFVNGTPPAGQDGGALLYSTASANQVIRRCVFINNRAANAEGGAVYVTNSTAAITIEDCIFVNN